MCESGVPFIILTTEITRNSPTPIPTVTVKSVGLILSFTCAARTVKSGSAIVMNTPITKHTAISIWIFLDFVSPAPM